MLIDAVGGALEVQADAAGIAGEQDAKVGSSWNSTMFWVRRRLSLGAGEKPGTEALVAQQVAYSPVGQGEHPPPLAEDHDLAALLEHDLPHELPQLDQLGRREALEHAFLGMAVADRRPDVLELELSHAVGDDPLGASASSST